MPIFLNGRSTTSEKGSIFILALVAAGLVSVIALLISGWHVESIRLQKKQKIKTAAVTIHQRMLNQIYNDEAWKATAGSNTCLLDGTSCGTSTGGPITLKNSDGTTFYDSSIPTDGFNLLSNRCNPSDGALYSDAGNDTCPFRYDLSWAPLHCSAGRCQIQITGEFKYSPLSSENKFPFSTTKWRLNFIKGFETESLQASCNSISGAFDQATLTCIPSNNQTIQCQDGTVFRSVDSTQVPVCDTFKPLESCPAGMIARGIASDGQLNCVDPNKAPRCVYSRSEPTGPCVCTSTSCTQPVKLVWLYIGSESICNLSTAQQICVSN